MRLQKAACMNRMMVGVLRGAAPVPLTLFCPLYPAVDLPLFLKPDKAGRRTRRVMGGHGYSQVPEHRFAPFTPAIARKTVAGPYGEGTVFCRRQSIPAQSMALHRDACYVCMAAIWRVPGGVRFFPTGHARRWALRYGHPCRRPGSLPRRLKRRLPSWR